MGAGTISKEVHQEIAETISGMRSKPMRELAVAYVDGRDLEESFKEFYPHAKDDPESVRKRLEIFLRNPKVKELSTLIVKAMLPNRQKMAAWLIAQPAMEEIAMAGKSEKARVQAAKDILDRAQGTPPKQILIKSVNWHGTFDKEDIISKMKANIERNAEEDTIDVNVEADCS